MATAPIAFGSGRREAPWTRMYRILMASRYGERAIILTPFGCGQTNKTCAVRFNSRWTSNATSTIIPVVLLYPSPTSAAETEMGLSRERASPARPWLAGGSRPRGLLPGLPHAAPDTGLLERISQVGRVSNCHDSLVLWHGNSVTYT